MYAQETLRRGWPSLLAAAAGLSYAASGWHSSSLTVAQADAPPPNGALDPKEFKAFKLIEREKLTHNTQRLRFELPNQQTAGLHTASCLLTKALIEDKPGEGPKPVIRPYTPTSAPDAKGYLDLMVKIYPEGKMSQHLAHLKVGKDSLEMKGPILKWNYVPNSKKSVNLIAGGTGITPMMQLVDAVLSNTADKTKITLVYANLSEADIMLKEKIDALAIKHKGQFKAYYVVDKASSSAWQGGVGRVTADVLRAHFPEPSDDHQVFVCGPPGFMKALSGDKKSPADQGPLEGALKDIGWSSSQVFKF